MQFFLIDMGTLEVMNIIIVEVIVLLVVISFVVFLAIDDKKNQKIREKEDLEELEKAATENQTAR
ncbi:MAG: hypothetical protein GXP14_06335 [Gammaproteobacteria bacterium]|nr:hypothetical protein [Gammaproteobacteria bacterium]